MILDTGLGAYQSILDDVVFLEKGHRCRQVDVSEPVDEVFVGDTSFSVVACSVLDEPTRRAWG